MSQHNPIGRFKWLNNIMKKKKKKKMQRTMTLSASTANDNDMLSAEVLHVIYGNTCYAYSRDAFRSFCCIVYAAY